MDIVKEVNKLLKTPEYQFIYNNEHIKDRVMFLTLGGSYAYGTNIEGSDIDIRGIALNQKQDIIGLSNYDQYVDNGTDTTIYSFNKIISLILNCNPNTIEMLGCKPEHYFMMSPLGRELIDNVHMFLSKRAVYSFGGYANAQLRRLQNALARDKYTQSEKERHILSSVQGVMLSFGERYKDFENGSVKLSIDKSDKEEFETEIFVDVNLRHYPLRDYKGMWSEMNTIVKEYSHLNGRNKKKDEMHLNKHMCHLVRLYLMAFDILENEKVITYRENDHGLLMSIRNGDFIDLDGKCKPEFFEMINNYEKRLEYDSNNTSLPDTPNYKQVEEYVMSVNKKVVEGDI
jgi:predicted nucleotidyltransferase